MRRGGTLWHRARRRTSQREANRGGPRPSPALPTQRSRRRAGGFRSREVLDRFAPPRPELAVGLQARPGRRVTTVLTQSPDRNERVSWAQASWEPAPRSDVTKGGPNREPPGLARAFAPSVADEC